MNEQWVEVPALEVAQKVGRVPTVPRTQYKSDGELPVVDQGAGLIAGYTDDRSACFPGDLPVILFGDHTRAWKWLTFPFAAGADGTQILRPIAGTDPKFVFYALSSLNLPSLGYSRHFKLLKESRVKLPPLGEQRKIAAILSSVDEAIEKTQAVIDQVQVVKKGLMQELLTRGLPGRHTKFKQTEIGEIPASWEVVDVGSVFERVRQPVVVDPDTYYRQIGIRSHAKGIFHKEPVSGKDLGSKSVFWVIPDALVLNIVFAWERAVATTSSREVGMICSHRFPMHVPGPSMNAEFATLFFQSMMGNRLLIGISPGGAGRNKTLNQSKFLRLPCPKPPEPEQREIADIHATLVARQKKDDETLSRLVVVKQALMSVLLTGEFRVTP